MVSPQAYELYLALFDEGSANTLCQIDTLWRVHSFQDFDYDGVLVKPLKSEIWDNFEISLVIVCLIIYMKKFLDSDWLRAVQLIPNSAES